MHLIITDAITVALMVSFIPMLAISICAGIVSLLQAITQVQEQSFVHLARLFAMVVICLWGFQRAYGEIERLLIRSISLASSSGAYLR